jgi:hypothetical protein
MWQLRERFVVNRKTLVDFVQRAMLLKSSMADQSPEQSKIQSFIQSVRNLLRVSIGPWEKSLLDDAERLLKDGNAPAALAQAWLALDVNRLPDDDYRDCWNYVHKGTDLEIKSVVPRKLGPSSSQKASGSAATPLRSA